MRQSCMPGPPKSGRRFCPRLTCQTGGSPSDGPPPSPGTPGSCHPGSHPGTCATLRQIAKAPAWRVPDQITIAGSVLTYWNAITSSPRRRTERANSPPRTTNGRAVGPRIMQHPGKRFARYTRNISILGSACQRRRRFNPGTDLCRGRICQRFACPYFKGRCNYFSSFRRSLAAPAASEAG